MAGENQPRDRREQARRRKHALNAEWPELR